MLIAYVLICHGVAGSRKNYRDNRRVACLIGLMGVDIPHENEELWKDRYVSEYTFREKFSNELQDETIVIIFAEISRFHKKGMERIWEI